MIRINDFVRAGLVTGTALALVACGSRSTVAVPDVGAVSAPTTAESSAEYVIGPLDSLSIFVWRNPDLSTSVPVRPDGRISIPLVQDIMAAGLTPAQLADALEQSLREFIQDPRVTVMVNDFVGDFAQQVRVIGQATQPQSVPYRENMTLLDLLIGVGGITPSASGNRAVIVRNAADGSQTRIPARLDDLLRGDISANVRLRPGDILIIPQSWF